MAQPNTKQQIAAWSHFHQNHGAIIKTDMMTLLREVENREADVVVLDPPSNIGAWVSEDEVTADEQVEALEDLARETARILTPGGVVIMTADIPVLAAWHINASRVGLSFLGEIHVMWDGSKSVTSRLLSQATSVTIYVKPGRVTSNPHQVLKSNVLVCYRRDPAERPTEMYEELFLRFTEPNALIVDPMCRTGAAMVAAERLGRRWLGADRDRDRCEHARYRVKTAEVETTYPVNVWLGGKICPL